MNIKQTIRQNILNIPGWRTNRQKVRGTGTLIQ